jgi:hypothetical protein
MTFGRFMTGGNDPYERLKSEPRAETEKAPRANLHATPSTSVTLLHDDLHDRRTAHAEDVV